jgi:2-octaprenyl-6-methoxyphenol hydroxylase
MDLGGVQPEVLIRAADEGVPQLGAVLRYGQVVAPLQAAWVAQCAAQPERYHLRFGTPVKALKEQASGVEVDADVAEVFDLAVVAEGGVFAEQARKAVTHDYQQTAWVGTVTLQPPQQGVGASAGCAFERFTRQGPVALLPLPPGPHTPPGQRQASLVWCVPTDDDPVAELNDSQRLAVLQSLIPPQAGTLTAITPLKQFALGLNAERSLVSGRTVRIGNAAQTLHPVAPDRWSMIAATDFLARSFTWRWPGLAAARGLGLAALQALPPVKSALARQMMFGRR